MTEQTIKTRILIISDTHCAPLKLQEHEASTTPPSPFRAPLPAADVLIHCGDLTHTGTMEQYHQTLDMLQTIQAPVKLVIAGNHDLTLDKEFMLTHLDDPRLGVQNTVAQAAEKWQEARDLWTAPDGRAKKEGITFLDEGVHELPLANGARLRVYASPYTPEYQDWAFPYDRTTDRFDLPGSSLTDAKNTTRHPIPAYSDNGFPIDILITHGPPYGQGDRTDRGEFAGCPHLLRAVMRARPLLHCFGHIHEGWGARRMRWAAGVEEVLEESVGVEEWVDGKCWEGVVEDGMGEIGVNREEVLQRRAAFVDVSRDGGRWVRRGRETVLVNAAVMDVRYRPVNAPWVVDLELPKAGGLLGL